VGLGALGTSTTALAAFVAGVTAVCGTVLWLQTESAMQNVLLPLASDHFKLDITASSGRADWRGRVQLTHPRVASPDGWVFTANLVEADLFLTTLATRDPKVDRVGFEEPRLEFRDYDFWDQDTSEDKSKLRWHLEKDVTVSNATVEFWEHGRLGWSVDGADLSIDRFQPDSVRKITVAAPEFKIAPGDREAAHDGRVLGEISFQGSRQEHFTWKASGGAEVWPVVDQDDRVQFDAKGYGCARTQTVPGPAQCKTGCSGPHAEACTAACDKLCPEPEQLTGSLVAYRKGEQQGKISGQLHRPGDKEVAGDLILQELGPAFLNPLLATLAAVKMNRGLVNGSVKLGPDEANPRHTAFESTIEGEGVVLRALGIRDPTPPLRLSSSQTGTWAPDGNPETGPFTGLFTLATTKVDVNQGRRRVAKIALERKLELYLGEAKKQKKSPDARLVGSITALPASQLRPWTALFGIPGMDYVDRGLFTGNASLLVRNGGKKLDVDVTLDVQDLHLWEEGESVGPFAVHSVAAAEVAELHAITLTSSKTSMSARGRRVAGLDAHGTADTNGSTNLVLDVNASDAVAVGRALRLVPEHVKHSTAGALDAELALTSDVDDAPFLLQGSASIGDGGIIGIDGSWPRVAGEGRVELGLANVNLAPWLYAWEWVAWPGLRSAPANGSLIITRTDQRIHLTGKQRIGPLKLPASDTKLEAVTLDLRPAFDLRGDLLTGDIEITGSRDGVTREKVSIEEFTTDLSKDPSFMEGKGSFSNVNFDIYSNTLLGLDESDQATELADLMTTKMPVDFNITMQLENVAVWGMDFASGSIMMRSYAGNLLVNLYPSKFSGGDIKGFLDFRPAGKDLGVEYELKGKKVDVGKLLAVLDPEREPALSGFGNLTVTGKGYGKGQRLVDSLTGKVHFELGSGELLSAGLLASMVETTTLGFLDVAHFELMEGEVLIGKGEARIDHIVMQNHRTKFTAAGAIALDSDWTQNVQVQPWVNGSIAAGMAHIVGNSALVGDDGFTRLPMSIVVTGPSDKLDYAISRRAGAEEQTGIMKVGGDLVKGVFGLKKKD